MIDTPATAPAKSWPDYRAVWRWHFYASLFCIPFVVVLSISGAIYLFKPQIEAWNDRAFDQLDLRGQPAAVSRQVQAALASVPGSTPQGYELPSHPESAGRVIVSQGGTSLRVYVHPETSHVMHSVPEDQRFMRQMFRLHGELFMGDRGSNLVELAACWTIVMIVTGVYLWWPRNSKGMGGILYPRLRRGSNILWRDLHSVAGIWLSAFAIFLLLTGLPWAKFWGSYFKAVRHVTGTAVAQQDWTTGSERNSSRSSRGGSGGDHQGHGGHENGNARNVRRGGTSWPPVDLTGFDRVAATVRPLDLAPPVVISPPTRGAKHWSAKSMAQNRPLRVNLEVDGTTGEIVSREDFRDRHLVDRIVGTCIAAHEGQLFGWPNQLLGLLTALGLVLLCVSGAIMWWRRRDEGVLGAPKALLRPRVSWGLIVVILALGLYLPLFGVSLVIVLVVEWSLLRRLPRVRDWLGLTSPASLAAAHP